ncbi:HNH endonuclease [Candidatus Pacearchaeota archaeon]|jgi:hypothetical protein|nr:HNH endonuclease [Candidatus Pacearchaeota archaeon]
MIIYCKQCNKEIIVKENAGKRIFCSRACINKWHNINNPNFGFNGKNHSEKSKKQIGDALTGNKNPNWNNGISKSGSHFLIGIGNGKRQQMHRFVCEEAYGLIQEGYIIHHVNGDGFNNDLSNLQIMTQSEHVAFHNKKRKNSKYKKRIRNNDSE